MTGKALPKNAEAVALADGVHRASVQISVASLRLDRSPRSAGEDDEHVKLLANSGDGMPPIIVHRSTMRVIDGAHRVRAAQHLGLEAIEARFFDGTEDDAFVLAVQANSAHGLPLSLGDRRAAAARIMATHPQWSDRRIASVTGLAGSTVGAIRRRATDRDEHSNTRVGRDGRERPVSIADGRLRAGRLLEDSPELSLREVARLAGVAPSTVRDVRERLKAGRDPVPQRQRAAREHNADAGATRCPRPAPQGIDRKVALQRLRSDPLLRFNESGRALLRWLEQHPMELPSLGRGINHVPPYWAGVVANLIRGNAEAWTAAAVALEQRAAVEGEAGTG